MIGYFANCRETSTVISWVKMKILMHWLFVFVIVFYMPCPVLHFSLASSTLSLCPLIKFGLVLHVTN